MRNSTATALNSDPWRISPDDYPVNGSEMDQLRFLVGYAVLAPSGHNTQPWLFRVSDNAVSVFADRTRALPVVDPHDRELTISCGAAIGILEIAMRAFGHEPVVVTCVSQDDPDRLAQVGFGPEHQPGTQDQRLLKAVTRRRTNRSSYHDEKVSDDIIEKCRSWCERFGCSFVPIEDRPSRRRIAELVAEGDRTQFSDPAFRRELAEWIHSRRLGSRDGLSGANFGIPDVLSPVGSMVVRTFDLGNRVAADDAEKITFGSPLLAAITTPDDSINDWLSTGRALSHLLLEMTAGGFTASYLNQPIEVETLRPRLREAANLVGHPQLLIRIGRAPAVESSARRPLDEVLLS